MRAIETGVIYGLIGCAVAAALLLREARGSGLSRAGHAVLAGVFWPFFAPLLLGQREAHPATVFPGDGGASLDPRIRAGQEQLLAALARVKGVAEDVLTPEVNRVRALAGAMTSMDRRVREMDQLLATPEFDSQSVERALAALVQRGVPEADPRTQSVRARLRNVERLRAMRERTREDLERIILKLEEMGSQIKLLQFAGRSDAEVVNLIKDISDSVEGVTEGLLAAG